jgi:outer membrane lipase/esterase
MRVNTKGGASALAAIVCATALATAEPANAQQFTKNVGFGDSYVDTGTIVGLLGPPYTTYYPTGRFSGGTNFLDTMSSLLNITQENYALGGARAGTLGINGLPNLGFQTEVAGFIAAGKTFSSKDILTISIGGNDARNYYQTGGTVAGAAAASATAAAQATSGINSLVGVGAKTIVFTAGDAGALPEAALYGPAAAAGSAYSAAYNGLMQSSLAAIAAKGVRVEYVDSNLVLKAIVANQAATGIKFLTACPTSCIGNPALQAQYLFYFDGIHLTSAGFDILGKYVVNRLNAPLTFASQGQTGAATTASFSSTLFGRADLFSLQGTTTTSSAPGGPSFLGASPSGLGAQPSVAPPANFQAYILAKGGVDQTGASSVNPSSNTTSGGGTIGGEYRLGRSVMIGAAFDYTHANTRLANNAGKTEVDAYQLGLYSAWNSQNWFAQGLLSYGFQSYKNSRAGVLLGDLTSAPSGRSAAAAGKLGYLFNAGSMRIGPIAGLTYASSTVNGYSESGDAALALSVGKQTVEALVGSAGIQARMPFALGGQSFGSYVNLTAERDFHGNGRSIQYSATSAPLIVNTWNVAGSSQSVYGRLVAGVTTDLGTSTALNLSLSQTFGGGATNSFNATGGLVFRF